MAPSWREEVKDTLRGCGQAPPSVDTKARSNQSKTPAADPPNCKRSTYVPSTPAAVSNGSSGSKDMSLTSSPLSNEEIRLARRYYHHPGNVTITIPQWLARTSPPNPKK